MNYFIIGLIFLFLWMGGFIIYIKLTLKEKNIILRRKYIKKINNVVIYEVYDENDNKYLISSLICMDGNNIKKTWDLLIDGKNYKIVYYGLKYEACNLYPLIIKISQ